MSRSYTSPATSTAPAVDTSSPSHATAAQSLSAASSSPSSAAALQSSAGNAAVQEQLRSGGALGASVAMSGNPEVAGRTPEALAADLKGRIADYWAVVPHMAQIGEAQAASERRWVEGRGVLGLFIDMFNPSELPDAGRWEGALARWDDVNAGLEAAMAVPSTPEALSTLGSLSERALLEFDGAAQAQANLADEFQSYLGGFAGSAQCVAGVTEVGRDIAFAAAVGIAVVVAAPVVAGAAAGTATAAGLSTGAAAAVGTGATVLASAGIGAGIEGGGRAIGAVASEGLDVLDGDEFEAEKVLDEGVAGAERGAMDGVLSLVGAGVEKAIAPAVSKATAGVVGQGGSRLASAAVAGGLSGGASGGLTGAIDGGVSAALEGGDLGEVGDAMQRGLIVGALTGALLGSAGGAWASRWTPEALEELLRLDPEAFAARYAEILASMTPEERASFEQHLQGRRFVDKKDYLPAEQDYASGVSDMPPEHRYGIDKYEDWSEAAAYTDGLAAEGRPMTQADLENAHALAARGLATKKVVAGEIRGPDEEGNVLIASGGRGFRKAWSALSPEEQGAIRENPHLKLSEADPLTPLLSDDEREAGYVAGLVFYPSGDSVVARLDDFFAWYSKSWGSMDPVSFAALAQKRLISIHPFGDGNGRVTRLVMDHALQAQGLPPALVSDPNLDLLSRDARWEAEVRAGVLDTYHLAAGYADTYNAAVLSGDARRAAGLRGLLLGLTGRADLDEQTHEAAGGNDAH